MVDMIAVAGKNGSAADESAYQGKRCISDGETKNENGADHRHCQGALLRPQKGQRSQGKSQEETSRIS